LFEKLKFIVNNDFLEQQHEPKNITDNLLEVVNVLLTVLLIVSCASKVTQYLSHYVCSTTLVTKKNASKTKKSFQILKHKAETVEEIIDFILVFIA
jgi:hypothetical protein